MDVRLEASLYIIAMVILVCLHLFVCLSVIMSQKTHAYHRMKDNVPEDVKQRRLREVISQFHSIVAARSARLVGSEQLVLVKGVRTLSLSLSLSLSLFPFFLHFLSSSPFTSQRSKRSSDEFIGLTDGNIKCVFPDKPVSCDLSHDFCHLSHDSLPPNTNTVSVAPGDYVVVKVRG